MRFGRCCIVIYHFQRDNQSKPSQHSMCTWMQSVAISLSVKLIMSVCMLWRAVVTWRVACAFCSHRKDRRACRLIDVTIRTEHISVARPYAEHHGHICSTENVVFFFAVDDYCSGTNIYLTHAPGAQPEI